MQLYGLNPKHQILDNEALAKYKEAIQAYGMTYQLVPLDNHRHNITKKAIHFWKDHFIAVLSGTTKNFLLNLCCQVKPQAERQLLILRPSNANKNIFSYDYLHGQHDYATLPFYPIGMEALIHEKLNRRKTWGEHTVKGWVFGTFTEH